MQFPKKTTFRPLFYGLVAEFGFLELQDLLVKAFLRWSFRLVLTTGSVGGPWFENVRWLATK